ncbi:RHS repeat domain-containing protein [Chryseobacterium suipulveris]|uniref:RHS repeat domain-containing protein n=1 Tax=Chryseobacterium suipulveris TaxID=2929800 RepID=UPI00294FFD48|nr:RHS repeat-associated core domain-containing protein [Chryseobacterium suipulveris]
MQESGIYDFGARNYMPDLGRWFNSDPLAELSPDLTPYRFGFNNPLSFTDPTGMYEDGYGDYDDYGDDYAGHFDIDFYPAGWEYGHSDLWNIINFKWTLDIDIALGTGDGYAGDDYFADNMNDGHMYELMDDATQDPYYDQEGPGPKRTNATPIRQTWNYLADNIISKPIEGIQIIGYIFYGGFYALPKEAIKKERIENLHVKMDIITWGFKNGVPYKNVYKDNINMTESEQFEAFVRPSVEATTAPLSFGINFVNNKLVNRALNFGVKTSVKKGIYESAPKRKK